MKVGTFVLFVLMFAIAGVCSLAAQELEPAATATLDWTQLDATWKAYQAKPNAETAGPLIALLPVSGKITAPDPLGDAFRQSIDSQLNFIEDRLMIENDVNAAVITFRFLTISSGELEKKLELILGRFLIFSPHLFLQQLNAHRQIVVHLDMILNSYKFDGSLSEDSFDLERKHRIKLIEEIEDKELKAIKKECLRILKNG